MKKVLITCKIFIGASLIYYVYQGQDFEVLGNALLLARWQVLFLSLVLFFPIILLQIKRWKLTVGHLSKPISFRAAKKSFLVGEFANIFMPSKTGDFVRLTSLRPPKKELMILGSAIAIEKLYDLGLVTVIGLSAWAVWMLESAFILQLILFIFLVYMGLSKAAATCTAVLISLIKRFFRILSGFIPFLDLMINVKEFKNQFISLTAVIWSLHFTQIYLFFVAFKLEIGLFQFLACMAGTLIASLLPISFAGLGVREIAMVWFFGPSIAPPVLLLISVLLFSRYLIPGAIAATYFLVERVRTR